MSLYFCGKLQDFTSNNYLELVKNGIENDLIFRYCKYVVRLQNLRIFLKYMYLLKIIYLWIKLLTHFNYRELRIKQSKESAISSQIL